jgi:hypothetical protein
MRRGLLLVLLTALVLAGCGGSGSATSDPARVAQLLAVARTVCREHAAHTSSTSRSELANVLRFTRMLRSDRRVPRVGALVHDVEAQAALLKKWTRGGVGIDTTGKAQLRNSSGARYTRALAWKL